MGLVVRPVFGMSQRIGKVWWDKRRRCQMLDGGIHKAEWKNEANRNQV